MLPDSVIENNFAFNMVTMVVDRNAWIIMSMILMGMFVLVRGISPATFREYYSWKKLLGFKVREESAVSVRPFSKDFLLFGSLYALNIGYVVALISNLLLEEVPGVIQVSGVVDGIFRWLIVASAFFVTLFIKYAAVYLMGVMYGFKNLFSGHFIDFYTSSSFFYMLISILLSVMAYAFFIPGGASVEWLAISLIVFLFYRTLLIYIRLMQRSVGDKLYIFSYLCTTELIPIFIGLKFLVG